MREVRPPHGDEETEGRYEVVASLARGEVRVNAFRSMTEAILYSFEVEALVVAAGFRCPAMRVEMRGPHQKGLSISEKSGGDY